MKYVGIDLGGTTIKAGVVDEEGNILLKEACPTGVERGHEAVIEDMAQLALRVIKKSGVPMEEIESVGIGIPGIYDAKRNIVPFCTNLYWHEVPLVQLMQKTIDKPIYVGNDASVAGLAETFAGVCKGCQDSVFITLGTGVGGGVVLGGRLFTGSHGVGTGIGHMIVEYDGEMCTCGNRGCWERYTSATAIIRMARETMQRKGDCAIARAVNGDADALTAKIVMDLAKAGDADALEIFDKYVFYLCAGLVSLINLFDPQIIAIGGGVSATGSFLLDAVRARLEGMIFCKEMPHARIELARLGNDAGIIGAAMLSRAQ